MLSVLAYRSLGVPVAPANDLVLISKCLFGADGVKLAYGIGLSVDLGRGLSVTLP